MNTATWKPIADINELKRGDIIRNAEYDVFRVNGNFGDGVVIVDIENRSIETLENVEGWKKRYE